MLDSDSGSDLTKLFDGIQDRPASQLALGTAFVLAGQVSFVLGGYVLHFYLSRAIDPVAYGTYGVIMNVLTWTESALNNGVPWAIRRFLPTDPKASASILRAGLIWQMVVAAMLYALTMLAAPWFTGAIRDSSLTFYLRLALTDILLMALYTFYRAALNGFRLFAAQGASLAAYTVGKLASSLLLVGLGYALTGALVGNIIGSLIGCLAAFILLRRSTGLALRSTIARGERTSRHYNGRVILGFALPTVLFTLAGTFLTSVGLVGVKALVRDGLQVAYYTAANYLATAPTLLLVAFSLTLFPHLAGSIATQNRPLTRAYIRAAVRYLSLVLLPGTCLVLGTSSHLISLIYPRDYAVAAPLLNLLLISIGLYSLYMIFANAILAEGRVFLALGIPSALVPVSLLATWYLTERFGPAGAAYATVLTTGLALLTAAVYVLRHFAVHLDYTSLLRVSIASLALYGLTRLYVAQQTLLLPYYLLLGITYLALLCLLGEIKITDIRKYITIYSRPYHE